jgi:hypothetical protein
MDASSFLALVLVLLAFGAMVSMRQSSHDPFIGGLMKASMFPAKFLGRVGSGAKAAGAVGARAAPGVGKGAAAGGTKVSNWQKGETIFSGLSLATLPLLFIPFGGGGDDASADGSLPEGAGEQAAMVSSVSISSVCCSLLMAMMMMMMAMSDNE